MAVYDPFAPKAPEPEPAPAAEPEAAAPAAAPRPASSDSKIVVTLKGGPGFEAPWIVVHADTVSDAIDTLGADLATLMERTQKAAAHFRGGGDSAPAAAAPAARAGAPAGYNSPPASAPPKPFDDFVYKSGISKKNGKTWHAWMPPQQGDAREPLFFNA